MAVSGHEHINFTLFFVLNGSSREHINFTSAFISLLFVFHFIIKMFCFELQIFIFTLFSIQTN